MRLPLAATVRTMLSSLASLSNYLFIEHCRICNAIFDAGNTAAKTICEKCFPKLIKEPTVSIFDIDDERKLKVISATKYDSTMKGLIYKLKYYGDQLIAKDLGLLMFPSIQLAFGSETKSAQDFDNSNGIERLLVPIPLSKWRTIQRGFNQSELIAKEIAHKEALKIEDKLLQRRKHTKPQHNLSKIDRGANLNGAFATTKDVMDRGANTQVILVDDICTSGATLVEAAKTLNKLGLMNVMAVTASRAILEIERETVRIVRN